MLVKSTSKVLEVVLRFLRMVPNPYFIDTVKLFNLARASSTLINTLIVEYSVIFKNRLND